MKRLVWLLVALVVTALAQVQPADVPVQAGAPCCCGEDQAGSCGMPDCAPAPAASTCQRGVPAAEARSECRQAAPAPAARVERAVVRPAANSLSNAVRCVSLTGTPAARVPLFKAHCSFLI